MDGKRQQSLLAIGLGFVVLVWGSNTVVVKYLLTDMSPLSYVGLRFLFLLPFAYLAVRADKKSLFVAKEHYLLFGLAALCGFGIPQILGYIGLANTTAFSSALISSMTPVATLAISAWKGYEAVSPMRWIGVSIAIAGLAVFEGALSVSWSVREGDAWCLAGSMLFAVYNILICQLVKHYHPVQVMFWVIALSSAFLTPCCMPALLGQDWLKLGLVDWGLFLFSVIFPVVIAHQIWNWAIKQVGPGATSMWGLICPLITGGLSAYFLGSKISPHELIGALICLSGLATAQINGLKFFKPGKKEQPTVKSELS